MTSLPFLFETVLISLPGVMSPGPIIAVAIGEGKKLPHVGACRTEGSENSYLCLFVIFTPGTDFDFVCYRKKDCISDSRLSKKQAGRPATD